MTKCRHWGADASAWIGRRVELFRDPNVTFGKDTPGGTRIRAMSHIDGQKKVPLLVSRGKSAVFTVEPLADLPPAPSPLTEPHRGRDGSSRTKPPNHPHRTPPQIHTPQPKRRPQRRMESSMTTRRPTPPSARPDDDRLLRYEDVARMLTISKSGVEKLVHDGWLIPVRPSPGSRLARFRHSDIQRYIRDLQEAS